MGNGKSMFAAYSQGYNANRSISVDPDESDNYEIGYRSRSANSFMEKLWHSLLIMTT